VKQVKSDLSTSAWLRHLLSVSAFGRDLSLCYLITMSKHVTTEDFIERARKVHGDRYDYSKVLYVAAISKVKIICPEHGEFEQQPTNHYIGRGCRECVGNKPLTLDRFIERANKIHKGRYDYSRVEFTNVESKIEIICPDHGPFFQRLFSHLKGFNCGRCGQVSKAKKMNHSLERFLVDVGMYDPLGHFV